MILLLDAGNSRLKWALLRNGQFEHGGALEHTQTPLKELATAAWSELDKPEGIWVANVAGETLRRSLNAWVRRRWKLAPVYVTASAEQCGIRNAYAQPQCLGVDRWLALLAARERYTGPLCIVDCGTALTFDLLAADNRHLGGLIVPGLQLMRDALAERSEAIRTGIEQAKAEQVAFLGSNTGTAVTGGTLYAVVATIDRILGDLKAEVGRNLHCILTGGDATRLLPLLACKAQHEPDLVLYGLARLARLQEPAKGETAPAAEPEPVAASGQEKPV